MTTILNDFKEINKLFNNQKNTEDFTWITFYMEFADKLLEYKNDRTALIEKIIPLWNNIDMKMPKLELDNVLEDIDPFTIFGLFNKSLTDDNRISILKYFKEAFDIDADVPTSFSGVPTLNPQSATFYFFKDKRGADDINNLWNVFESAIRYVNGENPDTFIKYYNKVLSQLGIRWNITMALYWIRPYNFINLDKNNRNFLSNKDIFNEDISNEIKSMNRPPEARTYLHIADEVLIYIKQEDVLFDNFPELSFAALLSNKNSDDPEFNTGIGDSNNDDEVNYWLFSPGHGANKWDRFLNTNRMAMGGGYLGDLRLFDSRDDIVKSLQSHYNNKSKYTNDSLAFWQFCNEIKPGDIVFVKKGLHKIIGYGIVDSNYLFDPLYDNDYAHTIDVRWIEKGNWDYNGNLIVKTLTKINDYPDLINTINNFFETSPADIEPEITYDKYDESNFLDDVFISEEDYYKLRTILRYKKNLILQGAPGVGKTYISKRLAYSLIGCRDKSRVCLIQFHQSYSYEDFIMGYRPTADGFELKHGVFYDFCKHAQDDADHDYYFIIDEINRGNLSKIFGELFMLLENDKRGSNNKIKLLYKDELFYIPRNVYIIGLMNTADRSLALIDYALRRRFSFFELIPAFEDDNFRQYQYNLDSQKYDGIIELIKQLNDDICNDESLGRGFRIGHSYFTNLKNDNVDQQLDYIIEFEIIPLLEEYWFDDELKLNDWIDRLRRAL